MAYKLGLKKRPQKGFITVPIPMLLEMLGGAEEAAKDRLYTFFKDVGELDQFVHDKVHLMRIVNWQPDEKGIKMTEAAKWLKLAKRVDALNEEEEGGFTLSQFHVDLIWNRFKEEKFRVGSIMGPFGDFILDFQAVTGKHFEEEDPGIDEDND